MSNPRTKGRMISRDISNSKKFAALSPKAAVLFCMIIPHLNSHGKLNGGAGFIKDEICPRLNYISLNDVPKLMKEISDSTNMKWFEHEGRFWIHSINFLSQHQELKVDRLGQDLLPSYSGVNPDLVPPEVEVEEEDKERKFVADFFETIWKEYPVKLGRKEAERHYRASVKSKKDCHLINYALAQYLNSIQGKDPQYTKHGSTWFNNWRDYIPEGAEQWAEEDLANEQ